MTTEERVLQEIRKAYMDALPSVLELEELQRKSALTEKEVYKLYSIKVKTLQAWRQRGKGPKYVKLGDSVYYRRADLEAYFKHNSVKTIDQRD